MLEHIDWVDPDNIVLANSINDYSSKKMTDDVQINGVKEIRLLKRIIPKSGIKMFYFRYVVNGEIYWFYVGNSEPRKGVYYTAIHPPSTDECDDLNNLYKVLNRDDKLKELGI